MTKPNIQIHIIKKFMQTRIENQQNFYFHPSYSLEQKLLNSISRGDIETAEQTLNEINKLERAKLSKDTIRSLKNSLICSCTLFTRAIIKGGVDPENAFNLSDVVIQQIEETNDPYDLEQLEYEMLHTFIKALHDVKRPSYQFVVNKAIAFIHQEILNDLSLERIAEYVQVHPSYLSKVFKKEVGYSLTEYISKKRIEDSKYFLIHSNSPISDISNLFRFCNQSYYTSLFKKYTDLTPKQYRQLYSENVSLTDELLYGKKL